MNNLLRSSGGTALSSKVVLLPLPLWGRIQLVLRTKVFLNYSVKFPTGKPLVCDSAFYDNHFKPNVLSSSLTAAFFPGVD